jgi:peptidyl-tRNA hydrolase
MDSADYVLSKFMKSEYETMEHAIIKAADGVELWARAGVQAAMNEVNRGPADGNPKDADAARQE